MQKIAAYLLQRRDGMNYREARAAEVTALKNSIFEWLDAKGGNSGERSGRYEAEDRSRATFAIEDAADGEKTWWMLSLEEVTEEGRRVHAHVSVTNAANEVSVYVTIEAGSETTLVGPVDIDPRCPRVVRTLLESGGSWYHGAFSLRELRTLRSFEEGEGLVAEIKAPERTVPTIVITLDHDDLVLPRLDERLAYDLAGLANVVVAAPDATWALTDQLGQVLSVYGGSVRLYWPRLTLGDDPYRHPLWTGERLRSITDDLAATRERFRRQLRSLVMRASALSVVRPKQIDSIRSASSVRALEEMRRRAVSLEDHAALADLFAADNDSLRRANQELQSRLDDAQAQVAELQEARAALLTRVENAEVQLLYRAPVPDEIAPEPAPAAEPEPISDPPGDGEVRYYKKKHSTPKYDVMVRVADCGHDKWQGAGPADKARKGIARAEGGRNDWRTIHHCGSCTGGGMWRVRW